MVTETNGFEIIDTRWPDGVGTGRLGLTVRYADGVEEELSWGADSEPTIEGATAEVADRAAGRVAAPAEDPAATSDPAQETTAPAEDPAATSDPAQETTATGQDPPAG